MKTDIKLNGDVTVVRLLEQRLGADVAPHFKATVGSYVEAGKTKLVLDMSALTFMDSSGLGSLVSVLKMIGKRGDMYLAGPQEPIQSLFRLTRMDKVFRSFSTVDEAVAAFARP